MKKLVILFVLCAVTGFGQDKRLVKFLGSDFKPVPARKAIPYRETAPGVEIIPSVTIQADTSGLVYQNEYVMFRNYQDARNATAGFVKTTFVSNAEYQAFQNWVRDSIARKKIISECDDPDFSIRFVQLSDKNPAWQEADRDERLKMLRANQLLNWKTNLKYDDPELMPFLGSLYLPGNERFYKHRDFDKRVFKYRYKAAITDANPVDLSVYVLGYPDFWANKSVSVNDEYAVLGQVYDPLLPSFPALGLTGMQAHAFCHWKEMQLQQELNKQKLPYQVRVTLPLVNELTKLPVSLPVPAHDYTAQWKIKAKDYQSFVQSVRDSILAEHLSYQLVDNKETRTDGLKLIAYQSTYFDEQRLKFRKTDLADYEMIRYLYPLKNNPAIFKKYREQVREITEKLEGDLDVYKYYRMDIAAKAMVGKLKVDSVYFGDQPGRLYPFLVSTEKDSLTNRWIGMDSNFDYPNKLGQGTGVRFHSDYRQFIKTERVHVNPGVAIESQEPDEWVKGITYEQALAYYHWKFPVWKAKPGDNWQQYVYPSEEQFKHIQKGEKITVPEHSFDFPSPVFRYVVTFIPIDR